MDTKNAIYPSKGKKSLIRQLQRTKKPGTTYWLFLCFCVFKGGTICYCRVQTTKWALKNGH